ncbi:MAG TPA: hypothetical protein VGF52_02580 [Tepidisphaeraceae bacterium]|jgi:hypothetical protein
MLNPRRVILPLAAAAVCWTAGCQLWPLNKPQQSKPAAVPSATQQPLLTPPQSNTNHKVDQMDASAGSAEALARKTSEYTKQMSPLLNSHTPPPAPSNVQWLDPSEFRLGLTSSPASQSNHDAVKPVIDSPAPVANRGDVAKPDATNNEANSAIATATPTAHMETAAPMMTSTSDPLEAKFSKRAKDYPLDVSAQLEYQLLRFMLDEPSPDLATLSSLPAEDRELVNAVVDGLTNFRNALRADNNMLLSKKIKPILDLAERLRSQADLTIPTIALCTRVNGFGSYDPIDPARFAAGADHPVIVYNEVANFSSNLDDKQMWETHLSWDATLYTEQGMSVWSDTTQKYLDEARTRRHDFFVCREITLPKTLTIGRYLLKVSVVDTQSNRVSEATVPIVIAAQ